MIFNYFSRGYKTLHDLVPHLHQGCLLLGSPTTRLRPTLVFCSSFQEAPSVQLGAFALDIPSGHLPPSHHFCTGSNATSCDSPSLTTLLKLLAHPTKSLLLSLLSALCHLPLSEILYFYICLTWF